MKGRRPHPRAPAANSRRIAGRTAAGAICTASPCSCADGDLAAGPPGNATADGVIAAKAADAGCRRHRKRCDDSQRQRRKTMQRTGGDCCSCCCLGCAADGPLQPMAVFVHWVPRCCDFRLFRPRRVCGTLFVRSLPIAARWAGRAIAVFTVGRIVVMQPRCRVLMERRNALLEGKSFRAPTRGARRCVTRTPRPRFTLV